VRFARAKSIWRCAQTSRSIYPPLASSPQKAARGLIVAVALLHTVLAFVMWFSFLNADGAAEVRGRGDAPGAVPTGEAIATALQ
jgi:hypothetical protein